MRREIEAVFNEGEVPRAIQAISRYFGTKNYSLWHLFKYEQQMILERIFANTMSEVETSFRHIYEDHFSLIRMLHENHIPLPKTLGSVAEFVLNCDLNNILNHAEPSIEDLERLAKEIRRWPFKRDKANLDFIASQRVNQMMMRFAAAPEDVVFLERIVQMIRLLFELRIELDMWKAQNIFYALAQSLCRVKREQVEKNGLDVETAMAKRWVSAFYALGELLKVKVG